MITDRPAKVKPSRVLNLTGSMVGAIFGRIMVVILLDLEELSQKNC